LNSHLFLGVDGGQSSTKALIGDTSGRILGRGVAGPCNHVSAAEAKAKFLRTIRECVGAAIADAGLSPDVVFEAACFGMSGGPEDKEALLREAVAAERWLVTHDALIALSGALGGEDGIVAIAGTGSIAFGRRGSQTMRAGGWGYIFGDEGGAFWIVREALRAALRAEEGWGPETILRERLLQATGMKLANDLLHAFYTPDWPRSKVAKLAVEVSAAASAQDGCAKTILKCAGTNLSALVQHIHGKLWPVTERVPTSYIGGVFQDPFVLDAYTGTLTPNVPHPPVWDAAGGALIEALRLAGISLPLRQV
jgi:N-acetylglucosamine kinase-like BadF-type ATPase